MSHNSRAIAPTITFNEADLGPAMLACNPGERAWVFHKIEGGLNNTDAAIAAGYSNSSRDSAKSAGCAIAHRERVQAALLEMSRKLMRTEGPKSIKTLVAIRDDLRVKPEVRAKCATELLSRAGMGAVSESHLTVTHELNEAQMDQRILALAAELGLTEEVARKMLISPADMQKNASIVDAEFEDVKPEVSPAEQARRDRNNEYRRKIRAMSPEELAAHKATRRKEKSQAFKARRAACEAERLAALGREGLEDLLPPIGD